MEFVRQLEDLMGAQAHALSSMMDGLTRSVRELQKLCPIRRAIDELEMPTAAVALTEQAAKPNTGPIAEPRYFTASKRKEEHMLENPFDLSGKEAKLVEYSIVNIDRDKKKHQVFQLEIPALRGQKLLSVREIVTEDYVDSDVYKQEKISQHPEISKVQGIDPNKNRVFYMVLARYKRPEYDEVDALSDIRDTLETWVNKKT